MSWKIIVDSSCDLKQLDNLAPNTQYKNVPLTLKVGDHEFIDDENLDTKKMLAEMYAYEDRVTSSCPSPNAYLEAFEGADNIICMTISSKLSGSYNSCELAKSLYLESHPEANIFVLDTLLCSGPISILAEQINQSIAKGLTFDEVVNELQANLEKSKILFVLSSLDNLVKNGRVNHLVGKVVGLLNIRLIGQNNDGQIDMIHKARGQKKALATVVSEMEKNNFNGGRVYLNHVDNLTGCQLLEKLILDKYPNAEITIDDAGGLCSFYAEENGLLIGYQTK